LLAGNGYYQNGIIDPDNQTGAHGNGVIASILSDKLANNYEISLRSMSPVWWGAEYLNGTLVTPGVTRQSGWGWVNHNYNMTLSYYLKNGNDSEFSLANDYNYISTSTNGLRLNAGNQLDGWNYLGDSNFSRYYREIKNDPLNLQISNTLHGLNNIANIDTNRYRPQLQTTYVKSGDRASSTIANTPEGLDIAKARTGQPSLHFVRSAIPFRFINKQRISCK
jgi:hypothetical protein